MTDQTTPPSASDALSLFKTAPDDALLPPQIVAALMGVPIASLHKARCVGDPGFPPFIKIGARVRYRAGTVRKHIAGLEDRVMA